MGAVALPSQAFGSLRKLGVLFGVLFCGPYTGDY